MPRLKKKTIVSAATILVVAFMVGAAELLSEKEIIFPEIAALAVGALVAPKQAWKTNRIRMLFFIGINAVGGVLIVRLLPVPLWLKITAAFVLSQAIYLYSGTTFAPMISAMVLPVLLGTESWVYPIAAVCLTGGILLLQLLLEKTEVRQTELFVSVPLPGKRELFHSVLRAACVCILAFIAIKADIRFAIAPPLLVAFTEFSKPENKARKTPVKTVLLIFFCASAGSLCRWGLTMVLGLPLTVAAVTAAVCMLLLLFGFGRYLPPAGAMTVLAMLIPAEAVPLYPIQVLIGVSVFMLLARGIFTARRVLEESGANGGFDAALNSEAGYADENQESCSRKA